MAIITIFGLAGAGTSSCGKLLAEKLGYEFLSTGGLFRECAKEKGLTLNEYEVLVHQNPQIDKEFDEKIKALGTEKDKIVLDSRLAWHFVPHSLKIKFICDESVRIKRVASRDGLSFEQAKEKTFFRENLHKERYKRIYNLEDYTADENFDFVIDTSSISHQEVVERILSKLKV